MLIENLRREQDQFLGPGSLRSHGYRDESGLSTTSNPISAFGGGALIGALGGLIGLGGAARLPLLIGPFRFKGLEAVILNKAMSLVVVASALPFRAATVPFGVVASHWSIISNLYRFWLCFAMIAGAALLRSSLGWSLASASASSPR